MKYVIWGAGNRGKQLFEILTADNVVAFIDNDKDKQGQFLFEKPIIDFELYKKNYSQYTIIISIMNFQVVEKFLKEQNFYNYLVSYNLDKFEFDMIKKMLLKYKIMDKIAIYGLGLLELLILDFLRKNNYNSIGIIGECKNEHNVYAHEFPFYSIEESLELNVILVTDDNWKEVASLYKNIRIDDLSNISCMIPQYYNKGLLKFKNIHFGKRCFIIGNGPSLKFQDLECLHKHNEITFGVNMVIRSFSEVSWRPNYYFIGDKLGVKYYQDEIKKIELPYCFVTDRNEEFWNNFSNERFYYYHNIVTVIRNEPPSFSEDVSKGVYGLATIIYECMQFAVYMGFKEIYLLGIDSNFSADDEKNYFIPNYHDSDKKEPPYDLIASFLAYQSARHYAEQHGIKIYNATRGGKLEVFERVDFDSLFQ